MSNSPSIEQLTTLVNNLQNQLNQINSGNIGGINIMSMSQKLDNLNDLTVPSLRDNITSLKTNDLNNNMTYNRLDSDLKNHNVNTQNAIKQHSNNNLIQQQLFDLHNKIASKHTTLLNSMNNNSFLHTNSQNNLNSLNNNSHMNDIQNIKFNLAHMNTKAQTLMPSNSQQNNLESIVDNLSLNAHETMFNGLLLQQNLIENNSNIKSLQNSVNTNSSAISQNNSNITQNAMRSAANFGAFHGMGDDSDGLIDNTSPDSDSNTSPDSDSNTSPDYDSNTSLDGNTSQGGGDNQDSSSTKDLPGDHDFRVAWYNNTRFNNGEQYLFKGVSQFDSSITKIMNSPNNVTDLSWLGINIDQSEMSPTPKAKDCQNGFPNIVPFGVDQAPDDRSYFFPHSVAGTGTKPPTWINYCISKPIPYYNNKKFYLIPLAKGSGQDGMPNIMTGNNQSDPLNRFKTDPQTKVTFYNAIYTDWSNWGGSSLGYLGGGGWPGPYPTTNFGSKSFCYRVFQPSNPAADTQIPPLLSNFYDSALNDFSDWKTDNVTTMRGMFAYAGSWMSLTNKNGLSNWDTRKVTDMSSMFMLNVSFKPKTSLDNYNPDDNGTAIGSIMSYVSPSLNTDTGQAAQAADKINHLLTAQYDYITKGSYNSPPAVTDLDLWNVNNVNDMSFMFFGTFNIDPPYNPSKNSFGGMELDQWNTSKVTDMSYMLANSTWFSKGAAKWDTGKVTNMEGLFFGNRGMASVDDELILDWDTSSVENMSKMFSGGSDQISPWQSGVYLWLVRAGENGNAIQPQPPLPATPVNYDPSSQCGTFYGSGKGLLYPARTSLMGLTFGDKWDTSKVTDMNNMFAFSTRLNSSGNAAPKMKGWDVSKVTDAHEMFLGARIATNTLPISNLSGQPGQSQLLDLSGWTFKGGTDARGFINPFDGSGIGGVGGGSGQDNFDLLYGAGSTTLAGGGPNTFSGSGGNIDASTSAYNASYQWGNWNIFVHVSSNGYNTAFNLPWDNYSSSNTTSTPSTAFSPGIGGRCPKYGSDSNILCGICLRQSGSTYIVPNSSGATAPPGTYNGGDWTMAPASSSTWQPSFGDTTGNFPNYLSPYWFKSEWAGGVQKGYHSHTLVNVRAGVDKGGTSICSQFGGMYKNPGTGPIIS